ncbi:DUF6010 family protein [Oceanicoccus sp. KOV_DT_Chl]|uniref:DUF6010 family protein n=1 Tax=Oceanicoccus sp. KOV_DT_Chl TaxID=1904639 RepID=UPI000C7D1ADB|nr:DUF6010 family protein [Oceanicoccus sp. KOV_DT_Chl]
MITAIFLLLGVIAATPLLVLSSRLNYKSMQDLLGLCLVIAAVIYLIFSLIWGNVSWFFIELSGVAIYATFYWLANKHSVIWLAVGWLLHPLWDVGLHLFGAGGAIAPAAYVVACMAFDIIIAWYIFYRIKLERPNN